MRTAPFVLPDAGPPSPYRLRALESMALVDDRLIHAKQHLIKAGVAWDYARDAQAYCLDAVEFVPCGCTVAGIHPDGKARKAFQRIRSREHSTLIEKRKP